MKSENRSVAVFRDFEKLFKLAAFYQGQKDVLMRHVDMAGRNLATQLEDPDFQEGILQFDLLMTAVFSEGKEIFRSDRPESTMAYALFCEGVKSVIAARGLSGQELLQWVMLLREHLTPGKKEQGDLASVLWRNRFQHLRVSIYNALLEVEDIGQESLSPGEENDILAVEARADSLLEESALAGDFSKRRFGPGSLGLGSEAVLAGGRFSRDEFWSLPSIDRRAMRTLQPLSENEVNKLKSQLSSASYSERARNMLRFSASEVAPLRAEMESYDSNQIEFNLMTQIFVLLEQGDSESKAHFEMCRRQLEEMAQSIIERFHPSLILYFLKRLSAVKKHSSLAELIAGVNEKIRKSLESIDNQILLLEALGSPDSKASALQLLKLIPNDKWMGILDILIARRNERLLVEVLALMREKDPNFSSSLLALGFERLAGLIGPISRLNWPEKGAFLGKCLASRDSRLVGEALPLINQIEMPADLALSVFQRVDAGMQRLWMDRLLVEGPLDHWRAFVRGLFVSQVWRKVSEEPAVLMLKIFYKYFQLSSISELKPFVEERRLLLWPAYPRERDLILSALLTSKDRGLEPIKSEILKQESRVYFQSSSLRERLRSYNGR